MILDILHGSRVFGFDFSEPLDIEIILCFPECQDNKVLIRTPAQGKNVNASCFAFRQGFEMLGSRLISQVIEG
jgi:hypothetical protein